MSNIFIQFVRDSKESEYLQENHPNAFLLLCLIARRARRISGHPDGLKIGEAHVGDYKNAGIETRDKYRTAIKILEGRGHIKISETCRNRKNTPTGITTVGTLVKLIRSDVWDINSEYDHHLNPHRTPTGSPPDPHEQERTIKNNKEKEHTHHMPEEIQKVVGGVCEILSFENYSFEPVKPILQSTPIQTQLSQKPPVYNFQPINNPFAPARKSSYGKGNNVFLTKEQHEKIEKLFGLDKLEYWFDEIQKTKEAGTERYKSKYEDDYSAIISIKNYRERLGISLPGENQKTSKIDKETENKNYAKECERTYKAKNYRIDVLTSSVEIVANEGPNCDCVFYYEKGFKEKLDSFLKRREFKKK